MIDVDRLVGAARSVATKGVLGAALVLLSAAVEGASRPLQRCFLAETNLNINNLLFFHTEKNKA